MDDNAVFRQELPCSRRAVAVLQSKRGLDQARQRSVSLALSKTVLRPAALGVARLLRPTFEPLRALISGPAACVSKLTAIPANLLNEGVAATGGKQYSFSFEIDFAGG
jgi:hypothetical protein